MSSPARRRAAARFVAVTLVAAVSACSLIRRRPPAPLAGPVFPLAVAEKIPYEGRVVPPVALADGRLFFVTDLGRVHAVDVGPGFPAWDFKTPHPVSRPVGIGRNRVYVVDDDREIHALDFEGRFLWRKTLDETAAGPLTEAGERLYVGTDEGSLIALRTGDGSEDWRFRAGHAVRTGVCVWRNRRGTPFLLCGGDEGKIYFLSLGGRRSADLECGNRITLPPLLEGDRLYVAVEGDAILCLNLEKRSLAWRVRLAGTPATRLVADDRRLFFLTAQGVLVGLDKKSGSLLWWKTMSSRTAFDPVVAGDQVLAAALSERLAGFSARDGRETGFFQTDGEFRANPVWAAPRIVCHASDGRSQGEALLILRKQVQIALSASKPSPIRVGEEVVFSVTHAGFQKPRFEFILKSAAGESVVQTASARDSWTWYPDEEGAYIVLVRVVEGEQAQESALDVQVVR